MSSSAAVLERWRLKAHLWSAELELRHREPAGLSSAQQCARMAALDGLRAYRMGGVFPRNRLFPGRFVPFLRDDGGTLCAMGHLLTLSGSGDLVDSLARVDNHVRLTGCEDAALRDWLERSGLNLREAARIQPQYFGSPAEEIWAHLLEYRWWVAAICSGYALAAWLTFLGLRRLLPGRKWLNLLGAVVIAGLLARTVWWVWALYQ